MRQNQDESLNVDEAVALLRTSRPTFYRWLQEGRLLGTKIGRKWHFRRSDLEALLEPRDPQVEALRRELREALAFYEERMRKGRV